MQDLKMDNLKICQSCAMPLEKNEDLGTNADGSKNGDFCHYCYQNGAYTKEETMEEMIESCLPFISKGVPFKNEEEARAAMGSMLPTLKRWKK